jgi:hypothetical protein
MAIYYAWGNALVSNDELRAKAAEGVLEKFSTGKVDRVEFLTGSVTRHSVLRAYALDAEPSPIDFVPIGIGRPLSVQIRHVYTGNMAQGFLQKNDMLVASAMKSIAAYDGAPRAINFLVKKTLNNRNFRAIDATDKGTTLICYSDALAQSSSVVTVEVMFAKFPTETFDAVSQAFSSAAGIPVFAPASGYLAVAGLVTKLLGNIGKGLINGTPALKQTVEITFVNPGSLTAEAGFRLLIADDVRQQVLNDYKVNQHGMLVREDDENIIYDGPEPYVVISVDGRANDDFKGFAPTAATAAILDKFYNINEGGSKTLDQLVDGLKLYSDMKFREKANEVAKKMSGMQDKESKEYKERSALYEAYLANIGNAILKPKL